MLTWMQLCGQWTQLRDGAAGQAPLPVSVEWLPSAGSGVAGLPLRVLVRQGGVHREFPLGRGGVLMWVSTWRSVGAGKRNKWLC